MKEVIHTSNEKGNDQGKVTFSKHCLQVNI